MKKIFLFLSFVFAFYFTNAQVKEGVGGYATISAVSLVSGTTYNFTITGFNSNVRPRGQDSYTTLDLAVGCVIWSTDCNKFVIASVSANTGITMVGTMTSIDAAQAPPTNGTKIAVFKEITTNNFTTYSLPPAADGNGASLFGISIGMRACIDAHYRRQDSIAFANISGGGSIDTSYNGIQTLRKTNATYVKGNDKGLKITNKGDTAQVVGLDFPSLDYRTGSILSSDLIPISDGTNHYKVRVDSLNAAGSGLTKVGGKTVLGGTLASPTAIITDAINTLTVDGLQGKNGVTTDSIVTVDNTGKLSKIDAASISPKEITAVSTLPTLADTKIGNKQLYITATDTTELTYIGGNKWRADIVKGSSTPSAMIISGTQTIDYSNAIWKNPNISVISGQTVDYTYQYDSWKPAKGKLVMEDFGLKTDTSTLTRALAYTGQAEVYFKKDEIYTVGSLYKVPSGKILIGNNATLQQASGATISARILDVEKSDVTIENLNFIGQISTQTSEFSHAIYIVPASPDTVVRNINIRNCNFNNLRGDAIYIGASGLGQIGGSFINIDNVRIRNVIRNGISIVWGHDIQINGVDADSCGYGGIDIESDPGYNNTIYKIFINNVTLPNLLLAAATTAEDIHVSNFKINRKSNNATVSYASGVFVKHGIFMRNLKNSTVTNGFIYGKDLEGIYGDAPSQATFNNVIFRNVIVDSCNTSGVNSGYAMRNFDSIQFFDCKFYGKLASGRLMNGYHNKFDNCTFDNWNSYLFSGKFGEMRNSYAKAYSICSAISGFNSIYNSTLIGTGGGVYENASSGTVNIIENCNITVPSSTMTGSAATTARVRFKNNNVNGLAVQSASSNTTLINTTAANTSTGNITFTVPAWMQAEGQKIEILRTGTGTGTLSVGGQNAIYTGSAWAFATQDLYNLQAGATSDSLISSNAGVLKRLSIAEVANANLVNVVPQGELTNPTAATTTQSYTVTVSPNIPSGTDFSRIELYFNGIRQRRGAGKDYTITSSTTTSVTFDFFATVTEPVTTSDIFFVEIK